MSARKPFFTLAALLALAACSGEVEPAGEVLGVPGQPGAAGSPGNLPGVQPPPGTMTPATPPAPEVPADCSTLAAGQRRMWRLTAVQYDNSIRDLFGIDSTFGAGFPADEVVHGFNNSSELLIVTPLFADKLAAAAQDISMRAELPRLVPCAGSAGDDNCLREIATKFGERIFRRPLAAAEVDRYLALAKTAGGFEPGARLILQAFLQSPHFLYRFELGQLASGKQFDLNDYEIASELSYLLWQTTPDEALLSAARAGQLREPAQVRVHVDRMLASPRARPVVRAFVFDWLGLSNVLNVPKDTAAFPELTAEVRASLLAEAERFVDHVLFDQGGSLSGLLTSPVTFLDAKLAQFYGVAAPADPAQPVMLPSPQQRRGILTLGATMMTHARSNDSSPVHRGKLVRERLLCQTLPPPPAGVVIEPPPLDPNKTTRERYAAHSSVEPCVTCHRLMDPIGLSFEHFDGVGRYRADDNGNPIDVTGEIVGSVHTDGRFDGVSQLIDRLDASLDVQNCYSLSWVRFAYGMKESAASACVIERLQNELSDSAGTLGAVFGVLTQAEQFYSRTGDPAIAPKGIDYGTASIAPEPEKAPVDPNAPPATPGLEVTLGMNNDWGGGYCKTYVLKNTSTEPITWSVPLEVTGKISNHWECEVSGDTGQVVFTGAAHNKTIQPNGMAQFGFCGMR